MLTTHRLLGTYERHVDRYVALTPDARDRMIEAGLPADRLAVKPNFLADDPGVRPHRGGYALYVGRLTPEKGLRTLLSAWRELGSDLPLRIVGTGPLAEEVAATAAATPGVQYLGVQDRERVFELMGEADLLVFPSEWYETFGLTIIEAYAVGLPVVASDLGSPRSLVHHDRTGRLFRAGDPDDLVKQIRALLNRPEDLRRMRPAARQEFEALYSREAALHQLLAVYEDAMIRRRGPSARSTVRSA
jgi:glycosyltransferase involved in cell wall biosynthesis